MTTQTKNNVKKISYLSAIVIAVGSTIGAGIFFKNGSIFSNADGHLGFMIASWAIAIFGVMAMGIALIEVASANKKNGGIVEWVKMLTTKRIGKFSASYMVLVYYPINFLALPIYAVMSLQDVTGNSWITNGWIVSLIAFGFFSWISIMSYARLKVAEKFQWIVTAVKFFPIVIIPFFGIAQSANDGVHLNIAISSASGLTHFSPWLGLLASIPAILFAFDGFYTVVAIQNDLDKPKKIGPVVAISISIISGAYLFYAILTGMSGATKIDGIRILGQSKIAMGIMNGAIMLAILGIVNGFGISASNVYYEVCQQDKELAMSKIIQKVVKKIKNERFASWLSSYILTTLFYIVLVPITIFVWKDTTYINEKPEGIYGATAGSLYEMADLATNFTSMFIFAFIGVAIAGGLVNRKTQRVEVIKNKLFPVTAWIAVIFLAIGTVYMLVAGAVDISGINGADSKTAAVKYGIMIGTSLISFLPQAIPFTIRKVKKLFAKN